MKVQGSYFILFFTFEIRGHDPRKNLSSRFPAAHLRFSSTLMKNPPTSLQHISQAFYHCPWGLTTRSVEVEKVSSPDEGP